MINLVPLEDELGDVLEKAMRRAGLNEQELSLRAGVSASAITDAINYQSELSGEELRRLAVVLRLNEVGLCALGCGRYPMPPLACLPFCVYPLRMKHGIGVTNAYLVAECGSARGVLFDTGPGIEDLRAVWPRAIKRLDAIFLTHVEAEHVGGLCDAVEQFGAGAAYYPAGSEVACASPIAEGAKALFPGLTVTTFSTPGHALAHNCYLVESRTTRKGNSLLISGDLLFAGSVGTAHHCQLQLTSHVKRMLGGVPPSTVIAPGHGPMTSVENELQYNPFVA